MLHLVYTEDTPTTVSSLHNINSNVLERISTKTCCHNARLTLKYTSSLTPIITIFRVLFDLPQCVDEKCNEIMSKQPSPTHQRYKKMDGFGIITFLFLANLHLLNGECTN